jgi:hypothetical protein
VNATSRPTPGTASSHQKVAAVKNATAGSGGSIWLMSGRLAEAYTEIVSPGSISS